MTRTPCAPPSVDFVTCAAASGVFASCAGSDGGPDAAHDRPAAQHLEAEVGLGGVDRAALERAGAHEESGGHGVASDDQEIVAGIKLLAESEGIFAETAGGVVIAGLKKLAESGKFGRDEVTVAYITGSGLKTQEAIEDALEIPLHISPTMASFEERLGERNAVRAGAAAPSAAPPPTVAPA